jgi:hypothetical protein
VQPETQAFRLRRKRNQIAAKCEIATASAFPNTTVMEIEAHAVVTSLS